MKKLLLCTLLYMPALSFAQPVINAVTLPIGDSISVYSCDKPQRDFPVSGFNNWDFSTLYYEPDPTGSMKILLLANTPYAADFPTANMCERHESNGQVTGYIYLQQNNDSLVSLGGRDYYGDDWDWTNPSVLYPFPFVLNQSFVDVYMDNTGFHDSMMFRYVAWGNITTPLGNTYNNVFLYEYNVHNENSWEVFGYQWISVATLQPVFDLFFVNPTSEFYENNAITSGINQKLLEESFRFSIYPNPSSTQSFIDFNLPQKAYVNIQMMAVDGRMNTLLISENIPSGKHHIPIITSGLAEGTYFVRMVIDNQVIVKTIEVVK